MDDTNKKNKIEDAEIVEETTEELEPADELAETSEKTEESSADTSTDESATESPLDTVSATESTEVVEDLEQEEPKYATPAAKLMELESLINRYVGDIEKVQEKMKTQRDMYNDAFANDAEYSQIMQKVKEINRIKSAAKQRIAKQPSVMEAGNRMLEYKDEMKELQEALSAYLQQYQEISGTNQITSETGEIREIVVMRKLVKKRA